MMKTLKIAMMSIMALFSTFVFAQQRELSGKVSDSDGLPLPGVSVVVVGTSNGVQTDFDGLFRIDVSLGDVLRFSYLGQKTKDVTIGNFDFLDVILENDTELLDEVVVTGYSTLKKSEVTGAIVQLGTEAVRQISTATVDQALQGQVAGLFMVQTSGTPGSSSNVRIRGRSSITAGNEPLYVIDGVPVNSGDQSISGATSWFSALAGLDSNNIESMTVLKDASATAQYGARGANGVIVITTKNGKSGTTSFDFNATYGYNNDAVLGPVPLTAAQRFELAAEAYLNSYPSSFADLASAEAYLLDGSFASWDALGRPEGRWDDVTRNEDAVYQEYNFSASGGDSKGNFYTSLGYLSQDGTVIGSGFERVSGSLNFQRFLSDKIRFTSNNSATYSEQQANLETSAYFASAQMAKYFMPSNDPPYTEDGEINQNTGVWNPLYLLENDIQDNYYTRVLSNNQVNIDLPIDGLQFTSKVNIDYQLYNERRYENRYYGGGAGSNGSSSSYIRNTAYYVFQNSLDYTFDLSEDHVFDVKVLQEFQKNRTYFMGAYGENFADDDLVHMDNAGSPVSISSSFSDWASASYLGLLHYTAFDGKYVLDASFRREGNSRFAADQRWGNFWAVGGAWNIHRESFMSSLPAISNFKLKASYGKTGNSSIGLNSYQALFGFSADYGGEGASYAATFGNNNLSWEKKETFDIGVDLGFLDNRINASFAYYNANSTDLLLSVPLSRTTGFSSQTRNVGALTNKGFEVELDLAIVDSQDFRFNIGGNLSTNENEVTALAVDGEGEEITITNSTRKTETGYPVSAWFMPTWAGVNPETGLNEYFVNGVDGATTTVFNEAEPAYQGGSALPTLNWGLNLNLEFKGFFLTSSGYFAGGHKVYEGWHRYLNEPNVYPLLYYNGYDTLMNRWQKPGDVTNVPKLSAGGQPWERQSRFLHDGDYFRLRDVTFGFNVPSDLLASSGIKSARLFVRGSNLYTWVKDPDNLYDPEQGISGASNQISTPATKSIMLGANIKF
jgi:TonB-linked SusC/RagA family outer membrane protein